MEEKGRQVSFMGEVYRSATRNLIWLGEEDDSTSQALNVIQLVLQDARRETDDFESLAQTAYDEHGAYVISTTALNVDFAPEPILRFFDRPWFYRLWVVQEAALSTFRICYCGAYEVKLLDILRAAQWLFYKQRFLNFAIFSSRGLVNAARVWEFADHEHGWLHTKKEENPEFRLLLHALRDFDAYDARDHVSGVLGLYQTLTGITKLPRALVPDYSRTLFEVFESATKFTIEEGGHLDVLSSLLHRQSEFDNGLELPSWVPRWNRPVENDKDASRLAFFFRADYEARFDALASINVDVSESSMLKGFGIDTISNITRVVKPSDFGDVIKLRALINETMSCFESQRAATGRVHSDLDIASTLVAGRNSHRQPFTALDLLDCDAFREWLEKGSNTSTVVEPPQDEQEIRRFRNAHGEACLDRRFFVTRSGCIGVGPSFTQAKDLVAIIYGCRWPAILRPMSGDYQMLGISYTRGIMHGEALALREADPGIETVFKII